MEDRPLADIISNLCRGVSNSSCSKEVGMPSISKQTTSTSQVQGQRQGLANKLSSNPDSILNRIKPVGELPKKGIKLLTYGRGKTGKTRLGCSFPKPVLIIGIEDGTESIKQTKEVDFAPLDHSSDIDDLLSLLSHISSKPSGQSLKYQTVVLDTAGGLQDMVLREVLGLDTLPISSSWGMADVRTWGVINNQFQERMNSILSLADSHKIHTVIIAHERSFNSEGGGSDVILPSVGASLTPGNAAWLNGACDYICQTYIKGREEVTVSKVEIPTPVLKNGKMETEIRIEEVVNRTLVPGKVDYCLRVGPHPVYQTGFRLPEGFTLPDVIINPTYEKIMDVIEGKYKET
jgi:hypothetical protein